MSVSLSFHLTQLMSRIYNASSPSDNSSLTKWAFDRVGSFITYEFARQGPNPQWTAYTGQLVAKQGVTYVSRDGDDNEFPSIGYMYKGISRVKDMVVQSRAPTPPPPSADDQLAALLSRVSDSEATVHELVRQLQARDESTASENRQMLQLLEKRYTDTLLPHRCILSKDKRKAPCPREG